MFEFLTEPGDTVLDIFAGSNTTGAAAEHSGRHWIAFEKERGYLAASAFRFLEDKPEKEVEVTWKSISSSESVSLSDNQR